MKIGPVPYLQELPYTCSVHQWIGNRILPQFDPRMSSLALLEADISSPLYVTGKNNVDIFFY